MRLLIHWLSARSLYGSSRTSSPASPSAVPKAALIAALVIGLVNATLGLLLKVLTFPLTILTLGLFWFVINALMLELASGFVKGFEVRGFFAAFVGAILMMIVSSILQWLLMPKRKYQ